VSNFRIDLDEHLFYLVGKALLVRNRSFEPMLTRRGLTINFWRVLVSLDTRGPLSTVKLAEIASIDRTTLTRTLDKMTELKLVSRVEDAGDGRVKLIKLTKAGKKKLDSVMSLGLSHNEQARRGIADKEYEAMLGTLKKVIANLEDAGFSAQG
jgi:DNA-binding MarR family transcriptional regulator